MIIEGVTATMSMTSGRGTYMQLFGGVRAGTWGIRACESDMELRKPPGFSMLGAACP